MRKIDQLNQLQSEMKEARITVEQLCSDWGWTLSNEKVIDNTDEIIALENEIAFKDGQIIGLKRQIKELEDKVAELQSALDAKKLTKVKPIQEELKEYKQELNKESDAMAQPKKTNSKINGLKSMKNNFSLKAANEELKAQTKEEVKEETVIEETKEAIEETKEDYKLTWKQMIFNEKVNDYSVTMAAIHGTITIKDKTYKYLAYNYLYYPIVYDCFDKEIIEITKEEIKKHVKNFNFYYELTENDINFKHANDKDYRMISWRALDANGNTTYHANVKLRNHQTIELAYDKNKCDKIMKTAVRSLFNDKPAEWRYLDEKYKELADKFMSTWPENFTNESQDTNEIVVDVTDPTAGSENLAI